MLNDESKMAVGGCFSFLNLRNRNTNRKLKLLFKIETQNRLTEQNRSTNTSHDRPTQIVKDLTTTDQVQVAPYTLSRSTNSDRPVYDYTSQPQIHKLGKTAYETNI